MVAPFPRYIVEGDDMDYVAMGSIDKKTGKLSKISFVGEASGCIKENQSSPCVFPDDTDWNGVFVDGFGADRAINKFLKKRFVMVWKSQMRQI